MAFDDATRGRLQKFVGDARTLLTTEFTNQFQQEYGLDPESGDVASLDALKLDDQRLETARILRQIFDHYLASAVGQSGEVRKAVLGRMVREQAFTTLNRLAALRMMEARGLLIECVAKGYQSKAFQLYHRVAGSALGEMGDTYRVFLLSLCDLYSADLPTLFDRHYPNGRLSPREPAVLPLLDLVNATDIAPLWSEDETIGWIYQYFNSQEERKSMREASSAPRNSRELAVRNQFFTPRYVVEFLVDNTLGRLWFDWTGGQTGLKDRCRYLLVKPDEQPKAAQHLRDPRTIKLLDPACGSMHFGLYAFDLFLEIYREAWAWEQTNGPGCLDTDTLGTAGLKPLCLTYADEAAFSRDVPRLVIEHNIFGVDIDPRAAQIASLALWLRAQRTWHDASVKAQDRPQVGLGHVVAAVAPPAELELRKDFMGVLDDLDAVLFEKTLFLLKGLPELGALLQIENELPKLIRSAFGEHGALFKTEDIAQWRKAELRLQKALTDFTDATRSTYQGRLFAQDALDGLRVIDITHDQFDVIVMNPPFGALASPSKEYILANYPSSSSDLLAVFVDRSARLLRSHGKIGCITSRTAFFLSSFDEWRKKILKAQVSPVLFVDLGQGVLDAAMVETAAYCLAKEEVQECVFVRAIADDNKELAIRTRIDEIRESRSSPNTYIIQLTEFSKIPGSPFSYWVPEVLRNLFMNLPGFESEGAQLRVTNPTTDEFRYLRNYWECKPEHIGQSQGWAPYAKGGSSQRYYYDINLVVRWDDAAKTYKGYQGTIHRPDIRPASLEFFFRPGIMWPLRANRMSAQVFPSGTIFSARSQCLFAPESDLPYLIGLMNSSIFDYIFKSALGRVDFPEFIVGVLRKLPRPITTFALRAKIGEAAMAAARCVQLLANTIEVDHHFVLPRSLITRVNTGYAEIEGEISKHQRIIDELGYQAYGISSDTISERVASQSEDSRDTLVSDDDLDFEDDGGNASGSDVVELLAWAIGVGFGRFDYRLATGERNIPTPPNPFAPLPGKSPGMLPEGAEPFHWHHGVLVDDIGHEHDLPRLIEEVLTRVEVLTSADVRRWLQREFFPLHLQSYSKSRRKAPIYWPLATASGGYTLWLYYPDLNSQTLYTAVNEFVEPKIEQVSNEVAALRNKGGARSRDDDKAMEALLTLEKELVELRDILLQVAPTYCPNHDDGVQITAAPLWPLFRHKPWQKLLKETWGTLAKGDYDWSHLAMAYWPDRVREKCKADKSLAIAHGLEQLYEPPPESATGAGRGGRKRRGAAP